nr:PREDICTED: uncharacterized protein LOC106703676 [Latimeria chalumnae]|eukprot:XP_014344466.1 PREDICTED: uncharacterized protein LOC106703676 [Latimeria chalumnae]
MEQWRYKKVTASSFADESMASITPTIIPSSTDDGSMIYITPAIAPSCIADGSMLCFIIPCYPANDIWYFTQHAVWFTKEMLNDPEIMRKLQIQLAFLADVNKIGHYARTLLKPESNGKNHFLYNTEDADLCILQSNRILKPVGYAQTRMKDTCLFQFVFLVIFSDQQSFAKFTQTPYETVEEGTVVKIRCDGIDPTDYTFWYKQGFGPTHRSLQLVISEFGDEKNNQFNLTKDTPSFCKGDSVTEWDLEKNTIEGETVILRCNYTATSTSNPVLMWYKQHLSRPLEYLLQVDNFNPKANRPGGKLTSELKKEEKSVSLSIPKTELSDSGVYYCALRPTVMQTLAQPHTKHTCKECQAKLSQPAYETVEEGKSVQILCKEIDTSSLTLWYKQTPLHNQKGLQLIIHGYESREGAFEPQQPPSVEAAEGKEVNLPCNYSLGTSDNLYWYKQTKESFCKGDKVTEWDLVKAATEGDTVTLQCNYTATTISSPNLMWYKQKLNRPLEYLLQVHEYKTTDNTTGEKFLTSELKSKDNSVSLSIPKAELSDSGVYYCALTEQHNNTNPYSAPY